MSTHPVTKLDRGRKVIAFHTLVDAPAEEIFAILANPHRHHEVDGSGTVKPSVIGPRALEKGDKFKVDMKMFRVPYSITSTVTEMVPNQVIEWQHPGKHKWRWELESRPDGRTRVTEVFDYRATPAPAAMVYERVGSVALNVKNIRASLLHLQQLFS